MHRNLWINFLSVYVLDTIWLSGSFFVRSIHGLNKCNRFTGNLFSILLGVPDIKIVFM